MTTRILSSRLLSAALLGGLLLLCARPWLGDRAVARPAGPAPLERLRVEGLSGSWPVEGQAPLSFQAERGETQPGEERWLLQGISIRWESSALGRIDLQAESADWQRESGDIRLSGRPTFTFAQGGRLAGDDLNLFLNPRRWRLKGNVRGRIGTLELVGRQVEGGLDTETFTVLEPRVQVNIEADNTGERTEAP